MNLFGRKNDEQENPGQEGTEQEQTGNRRKSNPILWIIVGVYLLYLDYNIAIKDNLFANGINSENWYFLVFVILFAAFAVWLFIRSFKQLKEEKAQNDKEYSDMIAEEEEEKRLREMYTKEDLEAFEAEQARLAEENETVETDDEQE